MTCTDGNGAHGDTTTCPRTTSRLTRMASHDLNRTSGAFWNPNNFQGCTRKTWTCGWSQEANDDKADNYLPSEDNSAALGFVIVCAKSGAELARAGKYVFECWHITGLEGLFRMTGKTKSFPMAACKALIRRITITRARENCPLTRRRSLTAPLQAVNFTGTPSSNFHVIAQTGGTSAPPAVPVATVAFRASCCYSLVLPVEQFHVYVVSATNTKAQSIFPSMTIVDRAERHS
ncbi:hypothetical protein OG21DRAFT_1526866 [Imleria badia]|nr:hypothetical protein OG21DRAFT_1526866 [Imleria badia]